MNIHIVYGLNNNLIYIYTNGTWRTEFGSQAQWVGDSITRNPDWWMTLYEGVVPTEDRLGFS